MLTVESPFSALTAQDLMSRDVVTIPRAMSLRGAARLLSQAGVSGAPVVDDRGQCIGVVSTTDFMHFVEGGNPRKAGAVSPCVHSGWEVIEIDELPADAVGAYMNCDPVMATAATAIGVLARQMIDAHIHRIVVVDKERRPIGVVSSTDILAAVADREQPSAWRRNDD